MKNLIASLALAVAVPAAAVPDVVTYAARVENDAGAFDGTVSATFSLFSAATSGNALWSETATSIVVVDGDLVHDLGSIEPLDDAVLDSNALFLEVTLNGDTLSPRAALRAVPFALKAREAETLAGLSADDVATDAEVAAAVAARVVAFNQLSGVPAGFADGVDNDTVATAAAGGGLAVAGNAFSVADNGVTLARMADSSVSSAEIVNGSITSSDLQDDAVTSAKLADNCILSANVTNASLLTEDLANNAITGPKINGTEVPVRKLPTPDVGGDARPVCGTGITTATTCRSIACNRDASGNALFFTCAGACSAAAPSDCNLLTDPTATLVGFLLSPSL